MSMGNGDMREMGTPVTPTYRQTYTDIDIYTYSTTHIHIHTHTHASTDMVTPTWLMRWGLICESDGATFVKRDSQLRQPGLEDNSLPVRVCVQYMQVHVCVCACA